MVTITGYLTETHVKTFSVSYFETINKDMLGEYYIPEGSETRIEMTREGDTNKEKG